jgi:hypothetical protein
MVVRRRRMTLRQLSEKDFGLGLRLSLLAESFRQKSPAPPTKEELASMDKKNTTPPE